jgi:hypothetical protein
VVCGSGVHGSVLPLVSNEVNSSGDLFSSISALTIVKIVIATNVVDSEARDTDIWNYVVTVRYSLV